MGNLVREMNLNYKVHLKPGGLSVGGTLEAPH